MTSAVERRCLSAIQDAWRRGIDSPRSTKKLHVLHGWLRDELLRELPDFEIWGKTDDTSSPYNREERLDGKYYDKNVDLVVRRDDHTLGAISVKFVLSSYGKNAANYFEHQLGETANLRGQKLIYGNVMFLPHPIPVGPVRPGCGQGTTEQMTDKHLLRYRRLVNDHTSIVAPNVHAIVLVRLDLASCRITGLAEWEELEHLSHESRKFLLERSNIAKFVRDYANEVTTQYNRL